MFLMSASESLGLISIGAAASVMESTTTKRKLSNWMMFDWAANWRDGRSVSASACTTTDDARAIRRRDHRLAASADIEGGEKWKFLVGLFDLVFQRERCRVPLVFEGKLFL